MISIAIIEVGSTGALIGQHLTGSSTQEDPFLIENAQDYQDIYDLVAQGTSFSGLYLKQVNDITLLDGWQSIGVRKDPSISHINRGANMYAFSGILDGNGKTVTVPEGCEPLLGYVKGATVKNLNIYGKQIAGDGTDECPTVAGCSWKKEHNRTDDPLGADAAKLCYTDSTPVTATELKVSGTYKTQYTTGDKLDLSGIVLTVALRCAKVTNPLTA